MTALALWWRLRRGDAQRLTIILSSISFAVATGVLLTVLGGLSAFMARPDASTYILLAQIATVILIIPVLTLGGAAARLAISRRDQRLAALRLAGVTSAQVGVIAVADAISQALIGALCGVGLYIVFLPVVALLRFQGHAFAWSELWLGPKIIALVMLGVTVLACVSASFSLAKVVISPLGVARRTTPKRLTWLRVAIAVLVCITWPLLFNSGAQLVVLFIFFGICFAILNLIGPWVLSLIGRIAARRATDVPALLSARRLADDPRSAWRAVSGVTLATFVAGVLSIAPGLAQSVDDQGARLATDLMTGAMVTLVIAALLAAVSSGITQAARVLEHRDQYQMLHLAGAELAVLQAARTREARLPLVASVLIAAIFSLIMVAPVGLPLIVANPLGVIIFLGGLGLCIAMVMAAVAMSRPLLARAVTG